jgi:hypothetical protein
MTVHNAMKSKGLNFNERSIYQNQFVLRGLNVKSLVWFIGFFLVASSCRFSNHEQALAWAKIAEFVCGMIATAYIALNHFHPKSRLEGTYLSALGIILFLFLTVSIGFLTTGWVWFINQYPSPYAAFVSAANGCKDTFNEAGVAIRQLFYAVVSKNPEQLAGFKDHVHTLVAYVFCGVLLGKLIYNGGKNSNEFSR